ncbi:hypothetical protein GCM10010464_71480 [Pseudonocardia yunnanensis]
MCQEIGETSSPAATTANGAVPAGSMRSRWRPIQVSVPMRTTAPSSVPSTDGTPNRTASPGSEALSTVSGTGSVTAMRSHSNPLDGPATSTPSSVATAAEISPARNGTQRRCTAGSSSSGASDGLSATVIPKSTAASTGRPRRSAIQPATRPASSNG